MFVLYVDDIRNPDKYYDKSINVMWAKNYATAIDTLEHYKFDIVDLDNDLGEEKEGYDIAKFMITNDIKPNRVYVHSMNPVAANNIIRAFRNDTNIHTEYYRP